MLIINKELMGGPCAELRDAFTTNVELSSYVLEQNILVEYIGAQRGPISALAVAPKLIPRVEFYLNNKRTGHLDGFESVTKLRQAATYYFSK